MKGADLLQVHHTRTFGDINTHSDKKKLQLLLIKRQIHKRVLIVSLKLSYDFLLDEKTCLSLSTFWMRNR